MKGLGWVVALALCCTACHTSFVRAGATAKPEETVSVGKGLLASPDAGAAATPVAPTAVGSGKPLVTVRLYDTNGRHPAGIPVHIDGPIHRVLISDAQGEVKIFDPGSYRISVPLGCATDVNVTSESHGNVRVSRGVAGNVALPVRWEHRFAPSAPVFADAGSDWPLGSVVHLTYTVVDRCSELTAPGAHLSTYEFRPSPTLQVVGQPGRTADSKGHATVAMKCVESGDAHVFAVDTQNRTDSTDLAVSNSYAASKPHCGS